MNPSTSKNQLFSLYGVYLVCIALALFFAKGVKTLYPSHFLVLSLAVAGFALNRILLMIFEKKSNGGGGGTCVFPFLIFQVIQGALGFALSKYVFQLTTLESLTFPLGALLGLGVFWVLTLEFSSSVLSVLITVFISGGLVVALRLGGVFGGLLFSIALLNGFGLGNQALKERPESWSLWNTALFFAALLAAGRAVIQYYLLESNYAALGVVITHPYTFAALFAGIFIPGVYAVLERDSSIPKILTILILGVFLPLFLGVFIHVRPMAGYLLGLVTACYMAGLLFKGSYGMGWVAALNLAAVAFGLPLFKALANLSRVVRLEILGGVFILTVIAFLFIRLFQTRNTQASA